MILFHRLCFFWMEFCFRDTVLFCEWNFCLTHQKSGGLNFLDATEKLCR